MPDNIEGVIYLKAIENKNRKEDKIKSKLKFCNNKY